MLVSLKSLTFAILWRDESADMRPGINSNYGDTATFSNIKVSGVKEICDEYTGTDDNSAIFAPGIIYSGFHTSTFPRQTRKFLRLGLSAA